MKKYQFNTFLKSIFLMLPLMVYGSCLSIAQTQVVMPHNEMIGKTQRTGLKTSIDFSEKKVESAWKDYLKTFGKVASSKNELTVTAAKVSQISDKPIRLISKVVKESNDRAYVFCVFDMGAGYITREDRRYELAERFMKDFALKMYRDEYGEQIKEAEKTFANAQNTEKKLIEKDEEWAKEIQKARQSIIDMENKIQEARAKIIDLEKQIIDNKSTKAKAAEEVEQNRIVVEQMKVKLGEIK